MPIKKKKVLSFFNNFFIDRRQVFISFILLSMYTFSLYAIDFYIWTLIDLKKTNEVIKAPFNRNFEDIPVMIFN